jgi:hypothetical protein
MRASRLPDLRHRDCCVNLATARSLGIAVPAPLLLRADEVLE